MKENGVVREWITADIIKLQRSIKPESITMLKKIFIFLMEHKDSICAFVDMNFTIKQFTQLIVKLFGIVPKAQQMRDFFSLLREILYYNQDIDDVDLSLLEETLQIMNSCLNLRHKNSSTPTNSSNPKNQMLDYFVFSKISPGIMLLSNFECQKEVQICLLFKISHEALKMNGPNDF